MRLITVDSIMSMARVYTDTKGAQNPPDVDLLAVVNEVFPSFYDDLLDASESDWYFKQYSFATQPGISSYQLPADHHRLKYADSLALPAPAQGPLQKWTRLRRMDEALLNMPGAFFGTQVPGGQTIRLSYNPQAPFLSQYAFQTILTQDGLDSMTITAAQPAVPGTAVKVAVQLGTGPSASVSVAGMTITITVPTAGATAGQVQAAFNAVPAATNLASFSVTNNGADLVVQQAQGPTALGGSIQFDFVNGWERYLVAALGSFIMRRRKLDNGPFEAEMAMVRAAVRTWASKRDSGEPQVCKDVMTERWMSSGPLGEVFPTRYGYRIHGQDPANPGPGLFYIVPAVPQ